MSFATKIKSMRYNLKEIFFKCISHDLPLKYTTLCRKEDKFQFHPKVVEEDNHQILPYSDVDNYLNKEEKHH